MFKNNLGYQDLADPLITLSYTDSKKTNFMSIRKEKRQLQRQELLH
jgi:hypothetical protein